jgi:hypothetical protein
MPCLYTYLLDLDTPKTKRSQLGCLLFYPVIYETLNRRSHTVRYTMKSLNAPLSGIHPACRKSKDGGGTRTSQFPERGA